MKKKVINRLLAVILCAAMLITNQDMACVFAMPENEQEVSVDLGVEEALDEVKDSESGKSDQILEESNLSKTEALSDGDETALQCETVETVMMNMEALTLEAGEKFDLSVTVFPETMKSYSITWTSSDEKVATVAEGCVAAGEVGKCIITASVGGKNAICRVNVSNDIGNVDEVGYDNSWESEKNINSLVGEENVELEAEEKISFNLKYRIEDDSTATIIGYTEIDRGTLIIPENIDGYCVTKVGNSAFYGCSGFVGDLTIPSSVVEVGNSAFYGCSGLSAIRFLNPNCQINDSSDEIMSNITIYGYDNSTAESYAQKYNRIFLSLGAEEDKNIFEQAQVSSLEVVKGKTEYMVGDTLNIDDLTAIAHYANESSKIVTEFKTNVLDLDMSVVGKKVLEVIYEENDSIVEASIEIDVKEKNYYIWKYSISDGTAVITGCKGLPSGNLVIPEKIDGYRVTKIGRSAFSSVSGFKGSLTIPDSVEVIGDNAFSECSGLTGDLTISENVKTIGANAFSGCEGMKGRLMISEGVQTIGNSAFSGSGFTGGVTIPSSVTSIGAGIFYQTSLTSVKILNPFCQISASSDDYIGSAIPRYMKIYGYGGSTAEVYAQRYRRGFESLGRYDATYILTYNIEDNGTATITGYQGTANGNLIIPEDINGHQVTKIGDGAFDGAKGFTGDLAIPEAIIAIGNNAFYGCSGFKGDLIIPLQVTKIGENAFGNCIGLSSIQFLNATCQIGDSNTTIAENVAIYGYTHSTSEIYAQKYDRYFISLGIIGGHEDATYTLTYRIEDDGTATITGYTGITSGELVIPEDINGHMVAKIGSSAFAYCNGFTGSLIIPSSVTEIGSSAFYRCSGFTGDLIFSEDIIKIGSSAFYGCNGFTGSLTLPEGITEISAYAFYGCNGFTGDLIIPGNVKKIEKSAFRECHGFTGSLIIPLGVEEIGREVFAKCNSLISIKFSNPVCQIGDSTITISENVTIYGYDNSTAEAYAQKYGRPFVSLGTSGGSENHPEQIQIKSLEAVKTKTEYTVGDTLNMDDLTVTAHYTDGSSKAVTGFTTNASSLDMSTAGQKTLTITYVENDITVNASIEINVKEKSGSTSDILSYEVKGDTAVITGSEENASGELVIPETIGGYKVTEIGDGAFEGRNGFTGNLVIPNGVTTIGDRAFSGCSGLTGDVIIPESVTKVGTDAFKGCSGISSIHFLNPECQIDGAEGTIPEGAVIYGYDNSTAEEYARKHTRPFVSLGTSGGGENPPEQVQVKSLEAVKTKTEYTVGDTLNTDDLTVTAQYTDGSSKAVTGFTTNASSLDMSVAGQKTLTVTYVENGVTAEASITIHVKETVVVIENCIITFDANGGVDLSEASRTVGKGETLGELPSVKRNGYIFKGWYTEKEDGQEVTEKTLITKDTTLYAHWEEDSTKPGEPGDPIQPVYKVTFYLKEKDGSLDEYTCYTDVFSGSMIEAPSVPEIEGCQFTGWYKDENCTVLWDFDTDVVTQDTILYAGWKQTDLGDKNHPEILPEDFPTDGKIPDGIWIAGIEEYVYNGEAVTPQVRVYNHDRRLVKDRDYTVSYKNNKKAAEASGKKSPKIIVKGKGNYAGKVSQAFTIKKAELTENCLVAASNYFAGNTYVPAVMLDGNILKAKTDYMLIYQDADGKKLKKCPVTEGSYSMHIVGKGSCTGEFIFPYKVIKDGRISIAKGKATASSIVYGDKEPATSLIVNGETLKQGTDYIVKFNNIGKKGTATAIFTGIEKYTGVLKKTFKVKAAPLPAGCVSVASSSISYEKGGARPDVTVMVNGAKLNEGIDYTVAYKGNAKAGSIAQVDVKGKGNYSGVQNASFSIKEKDLATDGVKIYVSDVIVGNKKPAVIVYDTNGKKLSAGSDYKAEIDTTAHKVTVTGGSNKLYTASTPIIREYQELDAGKVITSVLLNKKSGNFPGKFQYAANGVELDQKWLTVKAGKNVLSVSDFEIIGYINNASKGMATVIIQGKGEYGGTKALNFKIQSKSILSIFQ